MGWGPGRPPNFRDLQHARIHSMRNDNHILHGDQTRYGKNFYVVVHECRCAICNKQKINYMIFTQKTNVTDTLMNIKIDNVPIQKVHQTRFLGVIINDKLLWDDHIKTIRIKISKGK